MNSIKIIIIFVCAEMHADRPWGPPYTLYNSYGLTFSGGETGWKALYWPLTPSTPLLTIFHCFFRCPGCCNVLLPVLTTHNEPWILPMNSRRRCRNDIIIIIHGLDRLTCSGIDALPSFPGASTNSSSSGFVVKGVFRQSVVIHSLKVVDPILFVIGYYILYSRYL